MANTDRLGEKHLYFLMHIDSEEIYIDCRNKTVVGQFAEDDCLQSTLFRKEFEQTRGRDCGKPLQPQRCRKRHHTRYPMNRCEILQVDPRSLGHFHADGIALL
jgi:hypothetical protein